MRKKLFALIMSIVMVLTCIPMMAFAEKQAGQKIDVSLSSVEKSQEIYFEKDSIVNNLLKSFQLASLDVPVNPLMGFYNGKEQKLNVETTGVTVTYSYDGGDTWTSEVPTFKKPTVDALSLIGVISELSNETIEIEEFLSNIGFKIKADTGVTSAEAYVLPLIFPRSLALQFKSHNLGFAPGKKLSVNDVLEMKTLKAANRDPQVVYELVAMMTGLKEVAIFSEVTDVFNDFMDSIGYADILSQDKAIADKFMSKYVSLKKMPAAGMSNSINIIDNVSIDFAGILRDLESGTTYSKSLMEFLTNYDIFTELFLVQSQQSGIVYEFPKNLIKKLNLSKFSTQAIEVLIKVADPGANKKGQAKSELYFAMLADGLYNTRANLSYSKAYNKITASNVTKVYHVNKAGKLNRTRVFTFKAKPDYGYVTFKKLSGTKNVKIDKYTGKVTVKKGLKKNKTYKVAIKITAPGKSIKKNIYIKIKK